MKRLATCYTLAFIASVHCTHAHACDSRSSGKTTTTIGAYSGIGGSVTPSGLLLVAGEPLRTPTPDSGQPILYVIDDTLRPPSISRSQFKTIVDQALAAWSASSSVRYQFSGFETFSISASSADHPDDGRLRIQAGDRFNELPTPTALGSGGATSRNAPSPAGTGAGGQINGTTFRLCTKMHVIINHTSPSNSDPTNLAEVLTHEIGHSLGLGHSSDNPAEPDPLRRQATMFAFLQADGRGASLRAHDTTAIALVHPIANTPPWCSDRFIEMLTSSTPVTGVGLNEVTLIAHDRQSPASALQLETAPDASNNTNATFSSTGTIVRALPSVNAGGFDLDAGNPVEAPFARHFYRFSDGQHHSPWRSIGVHRIRRDNSPAGGDGIPDIHVSFTLGGGGFNDINSTISPRRPQDDPDGDGLTNLQEYRHGTHPLSGNSGLTNVGLKVINPDQLQFVARPWATYILESSSDLVTWAPLQFITPEINQGQAPGLARLSGNRGLLRIRQLP